MVPEQNPHPGHHPASCAPTSSQTGLHGPSFLKPIEGCSPSLPREPVLLETLSQRAEGLVRTDQAAHLWRGKNWGWEQEKHAPHPRPGVAWTHSAQEQQLGAVDLVYKQRGLPHHPGQPSQATAGGVRPAGLWRHLVAAMRDKAPRQLPSHLSKARSPVSHGAGLGSWGKLGDGLSPSCLQPPSLIPMGAFEL